MALLEKKIILTAFCFHSASLLDFSRKCGMKEKTNRSHSFMWSSFKCKPKNKQNNAIYTHPQKCVVSPKNPMRWLWKFKSFQKVFPFCFEKSLAWLKHKALEMSIQCRTPNKVPSKSKLNKCSFDLSMKYLCCCWFFFSYSAVLYVCSTVSVGALNFTCACLLVRSLARVRCQDEVFPKPGFDLLFVDRFDSQTFMFVVRLSITSLSHSQSVHSEREII